LIAHLVDTTLPPVKIRWGVSSDPAQADELESQHRLSVEGGQDNQLVYPELAVCQICLLADTLEWKVDLG
jgi:hypothetical protein